MSHATVLVAIEPHTRTKPDIEKAVEYQMQPFSENDECLVKDENTGAKIVVWRSDAKLWHAKFWQRFIKPLTPDTILVVVDYHV